MRNRFGGRRRSARAPLQPRSSDPTNDNGGFEIGWTSRTDRDVGVPTAIAATREAASFRPGAGTCSRRSRLSWDRMGRLRNQWRPAFVSNENRRTAVLLSSMRFLVPILAGLAVAYAGPCGAQAVDQKPSAAAPAQIVPEDTAPGRSGSSQEPLGKKLDRTDGVIHPPPGVDPGLTISPPHAQGTMPVLSPPGTPGGDPGLRPK